MRIKIGDYVEVNGKDWDGDEYYDTWGIVRDFDYDDLDYYYGVAIEDSEEMSTCWFQKSSLVVGRDEVPL